MTTQPRAQPDDETVAAIAQLARDLQAVDADEAWRALEGLSAEQREVIEAVMASTVSP